MKTKLISVILANIFFCGLAFSQTPKIEIKNGEFSLFNFADNFNNYSDVSDTLPTRQISGDSIIHGILTAPVSSTI